MEVDVAVDTPQKMQKVLTHALSRTQRKFPYKLLIINFHQKLNQQRDTAPS